MRSGENSLIQIIAIIAFVDQQQVLTQLLSANDVREAELARLRAAEVRFAFVRLLDFRLIFFFHFVLASGRTGRRARAGSCRARIARRACGRNATQGMCATGSTSNSGLMD